MPKKSSRTASAAAEMAAEAEPSESLTHLPAAALEKVFDLLEEARDIAAAACVCVAWARESARDHRWKAIWQAQVSDQGLWRWAKAEGGYREQLRANALVKKGDCVASVFPLSRQEGPVTEVLMLDAAPEPRIVTVQHRRMAPQAVRLQGATLKVWTASALCAQRPLLILHDVVKHLQLEDGRLFLWRIAGDAIIAVRSPGGGGIDHAEPAAQPEEVRRWTEHAALAAAVLNPADLTVTDIPLDSTFGRRKAPHEWMDMCTGAVAAAAVDLASQRVEIRLFDLDTGVCFRESQCGMPGVGGAPLPQDGAVMLLSRNSEAAYQVLAAAALFDCRVFRWRLRDEWLAPAARRRAASSARGGAGGEGAAAGEDQQEGVDMPPPQQPPAAAAGGGGPHDAAGPSTAAAAPVNEFALHHVFTMPHLEPIVDLSISTAARRIYVLGMENLFILGETGRPQKRCSMLDWRGVAPPSVAPGTFDVGAFSWPLPNSSRAAFYLDFSNSLFIAQFNSFEARELWALLDTAQDAAPGVFPPRESVTMWSTDELGGVRLRPWSVFMQNHIDLRPAPRSPHPTSLAGRATRPADAEQAIVEYVQSGEVLFTGGETSCSGTAALLRAEKARGTYLESLSCAPGRRGGKSGPHLCLPGPGDGGKKGPLAPRAIVCIDPCTGRRYKAIPVNGAVEAVHTAGHYMVAAIAPLENYPDGVTGSLAVVDFSGQGFGVSEAQRAAQQAGCGGRKKGQQQRQQQAAAGRGGGGGGTKKSSGTGGKKDAGSSGRKGEKDALMLNV